VSREQAAEFGRQWREAGLGPLFLHAPYMVNVASPSDDFRRRSVELARATVQLADAIGADGVVVHAGSAGAGTDPRTGLEAAAASLLAIAAMADHARVLIELTAGGAGSVASTFPQAKGLFEAVGGHERIGLCADTCHLFAAGYALDDPAGVDACFAELSRVGLARRLRLVHANDSKFPRGSRRDGHTHIGHGLIGEGGFASILQQPAVRRCAVVCETPGRTEERARDIATLRRLAGLAPNAVPNLVRTE
jgi:deoxyribonuclease-4